MLGQAGIPFEIMLWTECRNSLNLLKTHVHENGSPDDINVIEMTRTSFYMNMKNTYEKYRNLGYYRQVHNGFKIQVCNIGDVKHAVEDESYLDKTVCSLCHLQAFLCHTMLNKPVRKNVRCCNNLFSTGSSIGIHPSYRSLILESFSVKEVFNLLMELK